MIDILEVRLLAVMRAMPRVVVAFSGGVDSAVVAKAARLAHGDDALAITADSASVPRTELAAAIELAKMIGINHRVIKTTEFSNSDYLQNDGRRCYFCKSELYSQIHFYLANERNALIVAPITPIICSGANLDDNGDYRPGLTAAAEKGIRHPLQEANLTKADVRLLAKHWELPVWDKPASPCLSSRIVPGLAVTPERTLRIEQAEAYLKGLGLSDCRVRYHEGDLARIEVPIDEVSQLADDAVRVKLTSYLQSLGFRFVTLDLNGYRTGSMNELISVNIRKAFQTN